MDKIQTLVEHLSDRRSKRVVFLSHCLLNQAHGLTFIFSTHDPRLLEHVRRIVRLEDGHIVGEETGAPHETSQPQKPQTSV